MRGPADLAQAAPDEQGGAVGQCPGLLPVVGDEQDGGAQPVQDGPQIGDQVGPAGGVEAGEGFVEQEHPGSDGEGTGDRDALRLPAGQRPRGLVGEVARLRARAATAGRSCRASRRAVPRRRSPAAALSSTEARCNTGRWNTAALAARSCEPSPADRRAAHRRSGSYRRGERAPAAGWTCRRRWGRAPPGWCRRRPRGSATSSSTRLPVETTRSRQPMLISVTAVRSAVAARSSPRGSPRTRSPAGGCRRRSRGRTRRGSSPGRPRW